MEASRHPSPGRGPAAARKPARKIVYAFVIVLGAMGLLPLGLAAFKLINISRESLVTSQQSVQLQVAASTVRQLNAVVDGTQDQMERLAEAIDAMPRSSGSPRLSSASGTSLLNDFLGDDLLLLRYIPRRGRSDEARRPRFEPHAVVEEAISAGLKVALGGRPLVSDPAPSRSGGADMTVLVVTVPVGSPQPEGVLAGVFDFDTFWQPLIGGRRRDYTIYALDGSGRLFAAQDEGGILKDSEYQSFGVVQEFLQSRGYSALTTEFVLEQAGEP
ncbi:MAG: hypothetical protein V3U83_10195, partial [Acidobacteriota bacterium]